MNVQLRLAELALYSILRLLPYLIFMYYIFRNHLRFPKPITLIGMGLILLARIGCGLYSHIDPSRMSEPNPGLWVYIALSLLFVKDHFGKTIFTALMFCNVSGFTVVAAKFLEGVFFPANTSTLHRWSDSLMLLAAEVLLLVPFFFYIKHFHIKALEQTASRRAWRYLWCVPLTLYIVWFRNSFFSAEGFQTLALRPAYTFYCFLLNAGGMLIYSMVLQLINEQAENEILRQKEHILILRHAQYQNLQDRIEEARRAKHDIRKHIHVMSAYLKDQKYEELETYLNRYKATLPEEVTLTFCENYAVNALLQYFYGYAKMTGIAFSASVTLPRELGIPEESLAVLLGNLLENATEACLAQGSGCILSVRGTADEGAVFFKIINTCRERPKTDKQGNYLSSKRKEGLGIGIGSVRNITEQFGGMMKTEWADGVFSASVMLNLPSKINQS